MSDQLTDLEQLVLLAILRVGPRAYGAPVQDVLESRAERPVSLGTIYNTLLRLEERGFVRSGLGEPTPTRGGKAKRLYDVTPAGREALVRSRDIMDRMWEGLPAPGVS
jgi:PadR family transcriptional regulator PadR